MKSLQRYNQPTLSLASKGKQITGKVSQNEITALRSSSPIVRVVRKVRHQVLRPTNI